jgi:hypothetical protein
MSLPTTLWGIIGNPLFPTSSTNPTATVYQTAPGPNTTTPSSADGPVLGNFAILLDGTFVQFLQASGSIASNAACRLTLPWQSVFQVQATSAVGQICMAVNDRSQAALSANYCTFFTLRGLAFPLVAASVAAGAIVAPSGTAGTLYAATVGTDGQWTMENTVVVPGGGAALSPVYLQAG